MSHSRTRDARGVVSIRLSHPSNRVMVGLIGTRELVYVNGYGMIVTTPRVWTKF